MKYILIISFLLFSASVFSQQQTDSIDISSLKEEKEQIYILTEDYFPSYPGGWEAMYSFFAENLRYPPICGCVQGRVVIRITILEDGTVDNPTVIRNLHPDFDKEALRVIELMPKWNPAVDSEGKPIVREMIVPIVFKIAE